MKELNIHTVVFFTTAFLFYSWVGYAIFTTETNNHKIIKETKEKICHR